MGLRDPELVRRDLCTFHHDHHSRPSLHCNRAGLYRNRHRLLYRHLSCGTHVPNLWGSRGYLCYRRRLLHLHRRQLRWQRWLFDLHFLDKSHIGD